MSRTDSTDESAPNSEAPGSPLSGGQRLRAPIAPSSLQRSPEPRPAEPKTAQPKPSEPARRTIESTQQAPVVSEPATQSAEELGAIELSTYGEVDLMKLFPLGIRFTIRKTIGWFAVFVAIFAAYHVLNEMGRIPDLFAYPEEYIMYFAAALFVLKLVYWELYRRTLSIKIVGFRFITSRGLILKIIGSQPFVPFNEVFVTYDFFDLVCGTRSLHYYTFMDPTQKTLRFEGLTPTQASRMERFYSDFLSKQIGFPNSEVKATVNVPKLQQYLRMGAGQ